MSFPWEQPAGAPPKREMTLADYVDFCNSFLRMRVIVTTKGEQRVIGHFAIKDEGGELEAATKLPDGRSIIFELTPGPPRTTEPMVTAGQLIAMVMEAFNNGQI